MSLLQNVPHDLSLSYAEPNWDHNSRACRCAYLRVAWLARGVGSRRCATYPWSGAVRGLAVKCVCVWQEQGRALAEPGPQGRQARGLTPPRQVARLNCEKKTTLPMALQMVLVVFMSSPAEGPNNYNFDVLYIDMLENKYTYRTYKPRYLYTYNIYIPNVIRCINISKFIVIL